MSFPQPLPLDREIESLVFTHKSRYGKPASSIEEAETPKDWERVAFLGEGVLCAAMSRLLYKSYPKRRTSFLKPCRVQMLSKESLASITDTYRWMERIDCLENSRPNIIRSLDNRAALAESYVGGIALQYGVEKACDWAEELLMWKHNLQVPDMADSHHLRQPALGEGTITLPQPQVTPVVQGGANGCDRDDNLKNNGLVYGEQGFPVTYPQPSGIDWTPAPTYADRPPPELPLEDPPPTILDPANKSSQWQQSPVVTAETFRSLEATAPCFSRPPTVSFPCKDAGDPGAQEVYLPMHLSQPGPGPPTMLIDQPMSHEQSNPTTFSADIAYMVSRSTDGKNMTFGSLAKLNENTTKRCLKVTWTFDSQGQGQHIVWTAHLKINGNSVAKGEGQSKQIAKELTAKYAMEVMGWK